MLNNVLGLAVEDEGFLFQHSTPGVLSMANAGPNTNGTLLQVIPDLGQKTSGTFGSFVAGMYWMDGVY